MIKRKRYKIAISKAAIHDIASIKRYILQTFHYREYAENFSKKIKKAIQDISKFPQIFTKTGYEIQAYDIYVKICDSYLIFYVMEEAQITVIRVLKDCMNWQKIIKQSAQKVTDCLDGIS